MAAPPTYDLFVSYAEADHAWVEGYLLDALNQAGVHYLSEAAFALGVPRIVEFERAIEQSRRTLLVLSPAYLIDTFNQFTDLLAQSYGLETATWPVIPLILQRAELPARLAMLTALDMTDTAHQAAAIEQLCTTLQRSTPQPSPRPHCPYPGMVPFGEADSARFFGRAREVEELLGLLRLHPFLTVIGPSGSGKSSLVFAGLLPALRKSGLFGPGAWCVRSFRPGATPMAALTTALGSNSTDPAQAVATAIAAQSDARRLLIVVDQFEETFTVAQTDAIPFQETLQRLTMTPGCYVVLTVRADFYPDLMVSPLWSQIQAHRAEVVPLDEPGLHRAIVQPAEDVGVYVEAALVERLASDAASEPGMLPLVQETLVLLWEKVERRFLPLRAYEALVLPRSAYNMATPTKHTGLEVAIARRADAALATLAQEQHVLARRIFLRLIQFGEGRADTRRQQPIAALRAAGDQSLLFDETLRRLTDARLLTSTGEVGDRDRKVDIAHEALITGWPQLQHWLIERREAEQARRRLGDKVAEWVRLGRGSGGLLDQVELLEAERWLGSPDATDLGYDEALSALVATSQEELKRAEQEREATRRRELEQAQSLAAEQKQRAEEQAKATRRLRQRAVLLAIVSLLAVMAAIFAGLQQRDATNNAQRAEQEAATAVAERDRADLQARIASVRQLAAQAINLADSQLDLALLLSLEANTIADSLEPIFRPEARDSLLKTLATNPDLMSVLRGHNSDIESIAFSPDGKTLASGSYDGTVRLWDVTSAQPIGKPLSGHLDWVRSVAFSPAGKTLASGSYDGTVRLWDITNTQPIGKPLNGFTNNASSLAFSPDGNLLAIGTEDGMILLWDMVRNQLLGTPLQGHTGRIDILIFSPDGKKLFSDSPGDATIIFWDVAKMQIIGQPLEVYPSSMALSPDGKTLAYSDSTGIIQFLDVASQQPVGPTISTNTDNGADGMAFSPDGATLASGGIDKVVQLWDVATGQRIDQPLTGHTYTITSLAFNRDGKTLASASEDKTIRLWHVGNDNERAINLTGMTSRVWTMAMSADGKMLAAGSEDGPIWLWDVATGQSIGQPLTGHSKAVYAVIFSADGKMLASAASDNTVRIWDVAASKQQATISDSSGFVTFSSDSKTLLYAKTDGTVGLWDVATSKEISAATSSDGLDLSNAVLSPNGKIGAVVDYDTVQLWDVPNKKRIGAPLNHAESVFSLVFSADGKMLATGGGDKTGGDKTIRLWDVATGRQIGLPLVGHHNSVTSLRFSPDGTMLASGSGDSTVRLWDTMTSRALGAPFSAGEDGVAVITFSQDGKMLIAGGYDKTIRRWDVDVELWKERACQIANRNLTHAEWAQYMAKDISYRATCPNLPLDEGASPDAPTP